MKIPASFFSRSFWVKASIATLFLLAFIHWILHVTHHARHASHIPVNAAKVMIKPMPVIVELPGNVEPQQSVSIRSQVTGTVKKIDFALGDTVTQNQLLFEIDTAPYENALRQAEAVLARDTAQYRGTATQEKRLHALLKTGDVSREEYDQVKASEDMQKATVDADNEKVKETQIELDYTQIRAPIGGKTGDVTVKQGDLVQADTKDPLVTINQLDPVLVNVNLPQRNLSELLGYTKNGKIEADIYTEDGQKLLGKGELVFIDNNVNSETGTVLLKASVANPSHLLWPGLMVSVKLILTVQPDAIVVSSDAVKVDQAGNFVYRIEKGKAIITRVTVGRQIGGESVVKAGLSGNEMVITSAPPDLLNGSPVKIYS